MSIRKFRSTKIRRGGMNQYVAGLQGTKTVVVKVPSPEEYRNLKTEARGFLSKKVKVRVQHLIRNILQRAGHSQYSWSAGAFPGQIVVTERPNSSTLELPESFASSSISDPRTSDRLVRKAKNTAFKEAVGSPIQFPRSGTLTVDRSRVYYPTEIRLTNADLNVPVLFQRSKYLSEASSIWKLSVILGIDNFKKHLEEFDNVIDESFILNSIKDVQEVIYTNSDHTIFFDVLQPKFVNKYGDLKSLSLFESLTYLNIDDLEQLVEKTIIKKKIICATTSR